MHAEASKNIEAFQRFTPALFDEICGGSGYLDYATFGKPPENLHLDELAAVIIYLSSLSMCLPQDKDHVLDIVYRLDAWPAFLVPQNRSSKSPFAEFMAHRATEEREVLRQHYDTGLARFYDVWATLKLKELASKLLACSNLETLKRSSSLNAQKLFSLMGNYRILQKLNWARIW